MAGEVRTFSSLGHGDLVALEDLPDDACVHDVDGVTWRRARGIPGARRPWVRMGEHSVGWRTSSQLLNFYGPLHIGPCTLTDASVAGDSDDYDPPPAA